MDLGNLVGWIINLALTLATVGLLYGATVLLKQQAMDTQRHGMVSLGAFNRRLESGR